VKWRFQFGQFDPETVGNFILNKFLTIRPRTNRHIPKNWICATWYLLWHEDVGTDIERKLFTVLLSGTTQKPWKNKVTARLASNSVIRQRASPRNGHVEHTASLSCRSELRWQVYCEPRAIKKCPVWFAFACEVCPNSWNSLLVNRVYGASTV
jgi:hypothetical protein